MARTVYYTQAGGAFRLHPHSQSQVLQHVSAGRTDQVDMVEEEFFDDFVDVLRERIGLRVADLGSPEAQTQLPLPGGGRLELVRSGVQIIATDEALTWLMHRLAETHDFVLDPVARPRGRFTEAPEPETNPGEAP